MKGAEKIGYHALVIGTGTSTQSPLLGLNRDSESLRTTLNAIRAALPNAKHVAIADRSLAGVETAGMLGECLNGCAGWLSSKLENLKVRITLVAVGSGILPVLRPAIANESEGFLAWIGVTVTQGARVVTISPPGAGTERDLMTHATVTLEDGKTLEVVLLVPAICVAPNICFIHESPFTASDSVETTVSTLRVDKVGARVYAMVI
ncbi:FAD-dependent pyridine nucleotide-disulfide oxidoreductase [Penicillium digitatum]|uniref:FAD/NAD(P)-binding domain-containing protein n=3 Tax=Penicillium digitatum TaxID=36651 RepID=K9FZU5_PEND2|nr:hypothetical protein PDIP_54090 [Penicillium digitatum Pd1]EKV11990.1 hypothetical protein PDIP_54090 [Penicillium digitatum Pd1]EKV14112.1 hypothetical protein PDIG_34530 [Penicillium digitatum PHI26]QQK43034.1 FAD-dependent pyridine nucleotide-disulfide oxidoreductase [Penicillium digitatum]